jgi:antirestriction protein ArdC
MTDIADFEARVESARTDFAVASAQSDPQAGELFRTYWELLRDYNYAWTADAQQRLYESREVPASVTSEGDHVFARVIDEENNQAGLLPKWFADRAHETWGSDQLTEDRLWQVLAMDDWRSVRWSSEISPQAALSEINSLLSERAPEHDLAASVAPMVEDSATTMAPATAVPVVHASEPTSTSRTSGKTKLDIDTAVTERVLMMLSKGVVPWRKPWAASGGSLPRKMSNDTPYQGINALLLGMEAMEGEYTSPYWGTYKQVQALGGQVRKGEHHTMVIFFKANEREVTDDTGETITERRGAVRRSFQVFNAAQCDGLPERYVAIAPDTRTEHERNAACEEVVTAYLTNGGPQFRHFGDRAFYSPGRDAITIPELAAFTSPEEYYSTLFHEMTHSTGHASRLNREGVVENHRFGDALYSKEELVAEMGAAMACANLGIEQAATLENSAAYLASWISKLKGDTTLIFKAAAQAQRATTYMGFGAERALDPETTVEPEPISYELASIDGSGPGLDPLIANEVLHEQAEETQAVQLRAEEKLAGTPRQGVTELEAAIAAAHREVQARQVGGEIAALSSELAIQEAREEVVALENDLSYAKGRITDMRNGAVLAGGELRRFEAEARSEVSRAERIIADHNGGDPREFACRRLEYTMIEQRRAIRDAQPVSEEKERAEHHMATLEADYQVVIDQDADPTDLALALARVEDSNVVDLDWLQAQKAALSLVPPAKAIARSPAMGFSR